MGHKQRHFIGIVSILLIRVRLFVGVRISSSPGMHMFVGVGGVFFVVACVFVSAYGFCLCRRRMFAYRSDFSTPLNRWA